MDTNSIAKPSPLFNPGYESTLDQIHPQPADVRRTLAESLADTIRRTFGCQVQTRPDQVLLPCRLPGGTFSLAVDILNNAVYQATCQDVAVVSAGRVLSKDDDMTALLDHYQPVQWHHGDDGDYLFTYASSAVDFAERVLLMRDAALMLVSYAAGAASELPQFAVCDFCDRALISPAERTRGECDPCWIVTEAGR